LQAQTSALILGGIDADNLISLLSILILSCANEPDSPVLNPLDPSKPETNGDPFNLEVAISDQA